MIEPILPSNPVYRAAPIIIGALLDLLYPYHRGVLLKVHPVYTSYMMAKSLAPPGSGRVRGAAVWIFVLVLHISLYTGLLYASYLAGEIFWLAVASYIVKVSTPVKLLRDIVASVARCLEEGDIVCARERVSWIVRRDTEKLGEGHIASAAIESLFESTVDGISSPLLYTALLGPLGGLAQRIINTLDSALGYKTPEYLEAGWLSAKADTAVNFIPARLTALVIVLMAPTAGGSVERAYRIYRAYRGRTESTNAGHTMSAAAGCLGVRLEKLGSYSLGEGGLPGYRDIYRGLRLFGASLGMIYAVSLAIAVYSPAALLARAYYG